MIIKKVIKAGKEQWMADCRLQGKGPRFYADTEEEVRRKARRNEFGVDMIEMDDVDRLAKHELGDMGTLLEAVRVFKAYRVNRTRKLLNGAIQECIEVKHNRKCRPKYLGHLKCVLTQFLTYTGNVSCCQIGSHHITAFLESKPRAAATHLGMRTRLSAFFAFCLKRGYVAVNPVKGVDPILVERKRPVIFTVEEAHWLLDTALVLDPAMVPYFTLGLFCGIRPEEMQRMTNDCIKVAEAVVDIPPHVSKTRDRRLVELSANAMTWLIACGNRPLFYQRKRRREICELAKIKWHPDVMRHSFASYHIALHQSADKTACELGHHGNTHMLFKHYKATVTKEDAAAYWKLEPVLMPVALQIAAGE